MSFIMEFARSMILKLMEDPQDRDRKFRHRIYYVLEGNKKYKEKFSFPVRPYGHWTYDRVNSQLFWDPRISHAPGRRDPYDEVLEEIYKHSK